MTTKKRTRQRSRSDERASKKRLKEQLAEEHLYTAEEMLREKWGKRFRTVSEVEKYLEGIIGVPDFREKFCHCKGFCVFDGRGSQLARGRFVNGEFHLTLPRWARVELIILHELAHCLSWDGHGPVFCSYYLKLVRRFMGEEMYVELRDWFDDFGVKRRWSERRFHRKAYGGDPDFTL